MTTVRINEPFTVGEKPDPLEYQFLDANGSAMPITGYTAKFSTREAFALAPLINIATAAITDAANGKVTYTWTGAEFVAAGHFRAELWVGNGTQRYASVIIEYDVRSPIGSVPTGI